MSAIHSGVSPRSSANNDSEFSTSRMAQTPLVVSMLPDFDLNHQSVAKQEGVMAIVNTLDGWRVEQRTVYEANGDSDGASTLLGEFEVVCLIWCYICDSLVNNYNRITPSSMPSSFPAANRASSPITCVRAEEI